MNGDEFIQLAGTLAANPQLGGAAARNRTAISRAYYGVFHRAVELLLEFEVNVPENPGGHQFAYLSLFQSAVPRAMQAARVLSDLRYERIRADYRLEHAASETTGKAIRCVEAAHEFCLCAADCLEEPTRSQLDTALAE